jgi:predicted CXXCH cytochrome family protein
MVRQIFIRPSWLVIVLIMIALLIFAFDYKPDQTPISKELQNQKEVKSVVDLSQFKNAKENEGCLKCHGQSKYTYENPEQGKQVNKRMYSELIINPDLYYTSNHRQFKCTDCHSEDYATFPHPGNLRMESKATCIDCHGGDEQYAKFHFEEIDTGFMESVHSTKHSEEFTTMPILTRSTPGPTRGSARPSFTTTRSASTAIAITGGSSCLPTR